MFEVPTSSACESIITRQICSQTPNLAELTFFHHMVRLLQLCEFENFLSDNKCSNMNSSLDHVMKVTQSYYTWMAILVFKYFFLVYKHKHCTTQQVLKQRGHSVTTRH